MPFVRRDPFVLKLWTLGFVFVAETTLAHVFKRSHHRIVIPKVEHLEQGWVHTELLRCGVEDARIVQAVLAA